MKKTIKVKRKLKEETVDINFLCARVYGTTDRAVGVAKKVNGYILTFIRPLGKDEDISKLECRNIFLNVSVQDGRVHTQVSLTTGAALTLRDHLPELVKSLQDQTCFETKSDF